MKNLVYLITIITLTAAPACWAQNLSPNLSAKQLQTMRQAMENHFNDQQLVGFQAAIFDGNKIVTSLNLGYADLEHKVPVADNTRFEIASITKAFTALALYKLEDQGKIDLQKPVQAYVPEFPNKPEGTITPEHLAGFTSGIRHYQMQERTPEYYATHYDNVVDGLKLFADDPLLSIPGERFFYTSYGYNLLAAAIQGASGVKFQDYVQQMILKPLKLNDTGFIDVRYPLENRARTYSFIEPYTRAKLDQLQIIPTLEHSYNAGGGNLYSSANNLASFGSQFLQAGFISKPVLEKIFQGHSTTDGNATPISNGWSMMGLHLPIKYVAAGGSYPGTSASLMVFPDHNIVICFLTNTWGKDAPGAESKLGETLYAIVAQQ